MAKKQTPPKFRAEEYSYRVQYSPEDQNFIGLVDEFSGLSAFAETQEKALREIRTVVAEGLKLLAEKGQALPEPLSRREYSGKFIVRIDPTIHRRLTAEAVQKGMSLNQHVVEKLGAG